MDLQNIITKENLKQTAKVGVSVVVGVGLAYILNELGVTPKLAELGNNAYGVVGQWGKESAEFIYNHGGKYLDHIGIATLGTISTYKTLDKLIKK